MSGGELESTQAKNHSLWDAGAVVPTSFEALERIKDFRSWYITADVFCKFFLGMC